MLEISIYTRSNAQFQQPSRLDPSSIRLLEDLAVGPLVGLAVDLDAALAGPLVLDELAVSLALGVELGEVVALVVGSDVEGGKSLLAADKEGTLDDGVVGDTVDGNDTKEVLAAGLEASEETTYQRCQS